MKALAVIMPLCCSNIQTYNTKAKQTILYILYVWIALVRADDLGIWLAVLMSQLATECTL